MENYQSLPTNSRGVELLHKYHARDMTLRECYELERWLEEGPLKRATTPPEHLLAFKWVLDGVRALIIDKCYAATGQMPRRMQEKP